MQPTNWPPDQSPRIRGGKSSGTTFADDELFDTARQSPDNQLKIKDLDGATRRDRTGDLLITNQPLCVCTG
jgi:hypothetical protein